MSSRPQFQPHPVIVAGSMAASITSDVTIIQKLSLISYSYKWAGTAPVGTIDVQVSNDYAQNAAGQVSNAGTWNSLPLSVVPSISGNSGNGMVDIELPGSYAIRTVYTRASGTGTLDVVINAKVS